jgi:chromosomal replication initiation ATPase DnaA
MIAVEWGLPAAAQLSVLPAHREGSAEDRSGERRAPSIAAIKAAVAAEFDVSIPQLMSRRSMKRLAVARQSVMYLCWLLTPHSSPVIGGYLDRDHTTILYGIRRTKERIEGDRSLADQLRKIAARLALLDEKDAA